MGYDFGDRPRAPYVGDERAVLDGWLDFHRATLLLKCEGLTFEQLKSRPIATTSLSLLGLVRHMTEVERGWFLSFLGEPITELYSSEDNPEGEFDDVDDADAAGDLARFGEAVDAISDLLGHHALDEVEVDGERTLNLRWIMTHMIEEYARHNGHADLLREAIDGVTGE
jgi:uncharacterized damage-inducible protein DinB